ncbi:MAG: nitroreductase family protein [Chloroflexi bacterium]|nr:nitroreductase family protein [Chloroflexota bacterium]
MNAIFTRRSIRQYQDKPVSDDDVKKILEAGMSAPSAGNEKPWQFIVVRDRTMLEKLADTSPYAKMTANANLAIIICGDLELEIYKGYWVQDCSAATENMLLEIEDRNLGAVWLGVHPIKEREIYIKELFNLSDNIIPLAIIPIGYPGEKKVTESRYDESRVHSEKW